MFLFICFFCVIFSISFISGIIAFLYDIKNFNVDKKRSKIIASAEADGGDEDGIDGTDTECHTTDITELE